MFSQQQQLLKISYNELSLALDRLRYKVQYSSTPRGNEADHFFNVNGTEQDPSSFNGMSSTPLRMNAFNPDGFSNLNSQKGTNNGNLARPAFMGNGVGSFPSAQGSGAGLDGINKGAFGNNNNNNNSAGVSTGVFGNGFGRNGTSTPPNKHLVLSGGQSPLEDPQQFHSDWSALSMVNQLQNGNMDGNQTSTGNHHHNGSPINNMMEMMASPQAAQKMPLEDLLSKFGCEPSPALNFEAFYEQLTREESLSSPSLNEPVVVDTPVSGQRNRSSVSPSLDVKDFVPVEMLPPIHERHLTTDVRARYEDGRPVVVSIEGGKPLDLSAHGIHKSTSCQTLVEFKRKRMIQYDSALYVKPGSYVIVGGDRGEDLGLVIYTWCEVPAGKTGGSTGLITDRISKSVSTDGTKETSPNDISNSNLSKSSTPNRDVTQKPPQDDAKNAVVGVGLTGSKLRRSVGVGSGVVLREASKEDVSQLHSVQAELERRAVDVCTGRILEHNLPMVIVDAEYQYDKKKLTFYYEAQQRMDFRELVRDLYKTFRARIWMELVEN
ncbi:hypothetical protein AGDE_08855 [Angomonas deanei]|uniref:PSP1 C-terminal conserved region containing protein, putative n=1 Tax=Angomonas deanei TaxID=59799 RepID=A0A7G2C132_9TRYP|nr:hypothetical protein AGDE_08855 [Angomonas deanei]CAD2213024.1 PSP1 C-terminal conserved region containing protein, putative [Angomonas deanei]|eukprot:EPY32121.1 hypothetical protein AGDE_08855 [Angomonas deanei]